MGGVPPRAQSSNRCAANRTDEKRESMEACDAHHTEMDETRSGDEVVASTLATDLRRCQAMTLRVWARAFVATLAACLVLVITGGRAQAEGGKLVVIADGGGGEKLAVAIAKSLPETWTRSDPKAFVKAAKARKLPAAASLEKPKTRPAYVDKLGKATGDVGADAALVVRVTPGKKNRKAKIWIVTPAGRTVKEGTASLGAANVNADAKAVVSEISADLSQLGPAESKPDPAAAAAGAGTTAPAPAAGTTPPPAGAPGAPGTTPPATPPSGDPAKA